VNDTPGFDRLWRPITRPRDLKAYGFAALPDITRARRKVKRLTGESFVPVLVLDDGQVISGSKNIVAWARDHPADGAR
jgi:hypothetical protein